jgi:acetyl-CoA/propionyl-CoA carboxylase biotin carboxyl carrier protein
VLPFHRDIVRNPAFAPEGDEPFSVYTRWIETEYDNRLEPWSGELAESAGPGARTDVVVEVGGRRIEVTLPKKLLGGSASAAAATAGPAPRRRNVSHTVDTVAGDAVKAPMQATVVKVAVAEGDKVVKGDLVLVLEAMKMEQPIVAHKDGVIGLINAEAGTTVSSGHLLLAINDPADPRPARAPRRGRADPGGLLASAPALVLVPALSRVRFSQEFSVGGAVNGANSPESGARRPGRS